jgi:hypothetical protein
MGIEPTWEGAGLPHRIRSLECYELKMRFVTSVGAGLSVIPLHLPGAALLIHVFLR